jgi:hypothetical protein
MTSNTLRAIFVLLAALASIAVGYSLRASGANSAYFVLANLGGLVAVLAAIWFAYDRREIPTVGGRSRSFQKLSLLAMAAILSSSPLVYSLTAGPGISLGDILPISILLAAALASNRAAVEQKSRRAQD